MKRLINAPFHSMHRVMDMLCLNFGATRRQEIIKIGSQIVAANVWPTFSLHLQTQWRFLFQNKIILGSRDIYKPYSADADDGWDYIPTGRPDDEGSVFDIVSKEVSTTLQGQHIVDCSVSPVGDIRIVFSNGYEFEAFIPSSIQDEEWRLIDFAKDEHIIFYDV